MKAMFDYFITQLNDNELGLVYRGNYIFKFLDDGMKIYEAVTGTLVNQELEFSPVTLLSKTPVTFVESNKRTDWLVDIGIAVRINGKEYDVETDLDYANIVSVMDALQGKSVTIGAKKYSVKADAEPTYQGYSITGNTKYALLSITLNITEMIQGSYGQEWTATLGGKELDFTSLGIVTTKRVSTTDNKGALTNDYSKAIGRTMVFDITFNYNGESDLLNEVMGSAGLSDTYSFVLEFGGTYTYTVLVESAVQTLIKGGVMQVTLRLLQAGVT